MFAPITTTTTYYDHDHSYPPELRKRVDAAIAKIEKEMGAKFGSTTNPLLVSCRSGARDSMPGMMDTVLNIGLNDQTVEAPVGIFSRGIAYALPPATAFS
ncbi:MAG TPA: PEP/pyruvate-binding domain-containing protein [Pirellulales bacterium]|nr:PEP/pyruvate-binding domain-containing protein [Pirellulales bacterium]